MPVALAALSAARPVIAVGKLARSNPPLTAARRLSLFRGDLFQRFECALDGHGLGKREVLANGILGELAARDGVEINDVDRNLGPAEQFRGAQSALAGKQHAVGPHDNRM
jgi:hypothetical protein